MSTKHTPRPWHVDGDGGISCEIGLNKDWPIADCSGPDRSANAVLIAASPDLLAFAAEFVEAWDLGMAGDSSLLKSARAAIAKATGEQA
jgi:hypothetical protein